MEVLDQAAAPDRIKVERVEQRVEQRHVAGADLDIADSEGGGRFQRQRQHLGIRGGAVLAAERFDAGLKKLAGLAAAVAEHRAEIAEPCRLAGAAGCEVVAGHRNGQVRAQTELLAGEVRGQVQALANVLAGEVQERLGRLQDGGFGPDIAGLRERQQQRIRPGGGAGSI